MRPAWVGFAAVDALKLCSHHYLVPHNIAVRGYELVNVRFVEVQPLLEGGNDAFNVAVGLPAIGMHSHPMFARAIRLVAPGTSRFTIIPDEILPSHARFHELEPFGRALDAWAFASLHIGPESNERCGFLVIWVGEAHSLSFFVSSGPFGGLHVDPPTGHHPEPVILDLTPALARVPLLENLLGKLEVGLGLGPGAVCHREPPSGLRPIRLPEGSR